MEWSCFVEFYERWQVLFIKFCHNSFCSESKSSCLPPKWWRNDRHDLWSKSTLYQPEPTGLSSVSWDSSGNRIVKGFEKGFGQNRKTVESYCFFRNISQENKQMLNVTPNVILETSRDICWGVTFETSQVFSSQNNPCHFRRRYERSIKIETIYLLVSDICETHWETCIEIAVLMQD